MNKEELLKEIMKLPKAETINPISAMNSINIDDLMSAVDRLNKVPNYNDLLKENQKYKEVIDKVIDLVEKLIKEYKLNYGDEPSKMLLVYETLLNTLREV